MRYGYYHAKNPFPRSHWMIPCGVVAVLAAVVFGVMCSVRWAFNRSVDLGNKPPAQSFTRFFHAPVPAGIYNMKVAGIAWTSGDFWMRFQAKDMHAVIKTLKRNPVVPVAGPTDYPNGLDNMPYLVKEPYAISIDWQKVLLIKKPEYYEFATNPLGTGWWGFLIVDRKQNMVYVWGELL